MLIIFDLDDTLVDSSGSIIPVKLKAALQAMMKAGLKVSSPDAAFQTLLSINANASNGKETLRTFLDNIRADARFLEVGVKEYYGATDTSFSVSPLPEAIKVLTELKEKHNLVIVSTGNEKQQHLKLKKANIDTKLFHKIIVCEGYNKKSQYKNLMKEFNCRPENILVCGDKFETDLLPAKELGMRTAHLLWGRAASIPLKGESPDYSLRGLPELKRIVNEKTW